MSLEDLFTQYKNYEFACQILAIRPYPYDGDGHFLGHYRQLCDDEGVVNSNELYDKLKLYECFTV